MLAQVPIGMPFVSLSEEFISHDQEPLTAENTLIARPLSSSLYISAITPTPNTRLAEAPRAWTILQNIRLGMLFAKETPMDPTVRIGRE